MPILDLQKRSRELGRIRTGNKGDRGQPQKLTKFRLTSKSKPLLEKAAEIYGGTVREWTPQGGVQQWELYTDVDRLPIYVPPQPVTQWYEAWTAGGCTHRCDGEHDLITDELCDPQSPEHKAAKPTTRLNVVLKDVEGVGYWRLESHGFNAAVELPNAAEFLAHAKGYVDGWVALEERVTKKWKDGKSETNRFLVPIIEIGVTPAQLMAGQGRVEPPTLEGPVKAAAAIEAPRPDYLAQAQAAVVVESVYAIHAQATELGHMTPELNDQLRAIATTLRDQQPAVTPAATQVPDEDGAIDAEIVDPADDAAATTAWNAVLAEAGRLGMNLAATNAGYLEFAGQSASVATAPELQAYVTRLQGLEPEQVPA